MARLNEIFLDTIEECNFVHMIDIEFPMPNHYRFNDMLKFFDYYIYNISKFDNVLMHEYEDLSQNYELNIKKNDLLQAAGFLKKISMPLDSDTENIFVFTYEKHKKILDDIMSICLSRGKSVYFIFSPNFPDDLIILMSYKERWLNTVKQNISFENFSELDVLIFLSGYIYLFKSKNVFRDVLNADLDSKKIYILFYV